MILLPAIARWKSIVVSEAESSAIKQLATDACSVVSVLVTGGNSAAVVRIVDSTNAAAGYGLEDGFAIATEASGSTAYCPNQPVPMKKGLAVVFEQGVGSNAEVLITYN